MNTAPAIAPARVTSIDAYRGLVMFLMMAELLHIPQVAKAFPDSQVWQFLAFHTNHVAWAGGSLHDLIQPSFSFLVGVAVPYSIASRVARGQTMGFMVTHAVWRSLLLIFLGIFLRSVGKPQTNFTFEDTLTQIGLGYVFLFLLGFRSTLVQWSVFGLILVGYWLAFALHPLPPSDFNYAAVGVPADRSHHYDGLMAHWNKNTNAAGAFDQWFLNLFPRKEPFVANGGGYATLSFIPTLATMMLGLIAGGWLRSGLPGAGTYKVARLAAAGVLCLLAGVLLDQLGLCPIVKRIWTPAWVLYSGGWCFLLLAAFYAVIDVAGWRHWAFPLVVIGMNSIAIYCLVHLIDGFLIGSFKTHFGKDVFYIPKLGREYEPLVQGTALLVVFWLILFWMYRRRIFIKI